RAGALARGDAAGLRQLGQGDGFQGLSRPRAGGRRPEACRQIQGRRLAVSGSVDDGGRTQPSASFGHGHDTEIVLGGAIGTLTRGVARAGGLFLLLAVIISLAGVIGRYAFREPVPGDYELVELTCAVGVFLFFPFTHAVSGNIAADFFTAGLSERRKRLLDL